MVGGESTTACSIPKRCDLSNFLDIASGPRRNRPNFCPLPTEKTNGKSSFYSRSLNWQNCQNKVCLTPRFITGGGIWYISNHNRIVFAHCPLVPRRSRVGGGLRRLGFNYVQLGHTSRDTRSQSVIRLSNCSEPAPICLSPSTINALHHLKRTRQKWLADRRSVHARMHALTRVPAAAWREDNPRVADQKQNFHEAPKKISRCFKVILFVSNSFFAGNAIILIKTTSQHKKLRSTSKERTIKLFRFCSHGLCIQFRNHNRIWPIRQKETFLNDGRFAVRFEQHLLTRITAIYHVSTSERSGTNGPWFRRLNGRMEESASESEVVGKAMTSFAMRRLPSRIRAPTELQSEHSGPSRGVQIRPRSFDPFSNAALKIRNCLAKKRNLRVFFPATWNLHSASCKLICWTSCPFTAKPLDQHDQTTKWETCTASSTSNLRVCQHRLHVICVFQMQRPSHVTAPPFALWARCKRPPASKGAVYFCRACYLLWNCGTRNWIWMRR